METIFAKATGVGKSAVSIVRISGPLALKSIRCFSSNNLILSPRTAVLKDLFWQGQRLDRAIIIFFERNRSFTGEDSLSATIDIGDAAADALALDDTDNVLTLDGLTYTFPVGGASLMVGDNTDISAMYTGACAYNAFTDYMGNCGTGNSGGLGGSGVTAAMSYAFDGGFSLAGGVSSDPTGILAKAENDAFGIEAAYTADSYGIAVAYSDIEAATDATFWGVNAMYAFDFATISAGVESEDPVGGSTKTGFFVGLSFPEVGAGTFDIGLATSANYADADTDYYTYEASYSYPINDGMTITPGVFIKEGTTDTTGFAVKTSFSF